MQTTRTIEIDAPADVVWDVMADLERWPEWTPSIRRVEVLDGGALGRGLTARLQVLGAPEGTWTVTDFEEGRQFAWETKAPGVRTRATHVIEPHGAVSRVTLGVEQNGPGTWILRPWLKRVNVRNLEMEAQGLKRAAEARVAAVSGRA